MSPLRAAALTTHFLAVAPQIRRALENEKLLAARLGGMASYFVKVAESVDFLTEIRLILFVHNLAAHAEQVAHMKNNPKVPA